MQLNGSLTALNLGESQVSLFGSWWEDYLANVCNCEHFQILQLNAEEIESGLIKGLVTEIGAGMEKGFQPSDY